MKIRFKDFWATFDVNDNFFIKYLRFRGLNPTVIVSDRDWVDLEIHSVFLNSFQSKLYGLDVKLKSKAYFNSKFLEIYMRHSTNRFSSAKKHLWFTGENIRPPFDLPYDGFLSFDQFMFDDRNFYFPLWMTHLDWFETPEYDSRVGSSIQMANLCRPRESPTKKDKFACIFLSNPHPFRLEAIRKMCEHFDVDVFGSFSGRRVERKIDVSTDYKYTICFENDIYPGYVTEKILEAYVSETVPLYWGDLGREDIFNPKAFFNMNDYENFEEFIQVIQQCDYDSIYREPLFNHKVNFQFFHDFMDQLLQDLD